MDDYPLTKQGVRNLDSIKPQQPSRVVSHPAPTAGKNEILDGPMQHDLIYDPAAYQDVRDRFPHARVEHSYDYLHGERFSVEVPNCTLRNWLKFLISEGWGSVSLVCQFMVLDNAEAIAEVLDETNPGWRSRRKRSK